MEYKVDLIGSVKYFGKNNVFENQFGLYCLPQPICISYHASSTSSRIVTSRPFPNEKLNFHHFRPAKTEADGYLKTACIEYAFSINFDKILNLFLVDGLSITDI